MKKTYFLFLLSFLSYAAFGQSTVTLYATGTTGSYVTGTATSFGTRTDGNIITTSAGFATSRGYAVFDLSSLPAAGITITGCVIGFNVSPYGGSGTPSDGTTYGYAGDLSTVTTAATLYADMVTGPVLSTATYGTAAGDQTLPSTAASNAFVQAQIGNKVSICFTGGASRVYTITGETGTPTTVSGTTAPFHAPYLQITYTCSGVSGVSASATPSPQCAGSTVTLNGAATGTTSYLWNGPGGYTSTQMSPSFTSTMASDGVYTLTAYNAGGCGTIVTTTLSISATPVATVTATGNVVFCPGSNVMLTGPAGTGYTYQWSESGTAISGETNQSYVASTNGSYTLHVIDPDGCSATSSAIATAVLPASPAVSPAGAADLCIGGSVTLSVATGGVTTGVGYQWLKDGLPITGATNTSYTSNVSGNFYVIISVPGCADTSTATLVTVYPPPNPIISFNASTGLLSTSSSYAVYQWYLNSVAITGANSYTLHPPDIGSYRVVVTDPHGCSNFSTAFVVNVLGVNQVSAPEVAIYPNPAASTVHISCSVNVRAVVTSIEGKKLLDNAAATDIDISGLAQGLYVITLYNDAGERIAMQKLIKE